MTFDVKANAPEEKIREVVERAKARSVVYDSITRGVPVEVMSLRERRVVAVGNRLTAAGLKCAE